MQLEDFYSLLTREGQWAIESASAFEPREKDFLQDFQMLAKRFPRDLARAALETAILRREAETKFPKAVKMYFTRQALEQATAWEVAAYRARRYTGFERIFDLGCSIGADTLALGKITPTTGVELDPLRLAMAHQNARSLGVPAEFLQADLHQLPFKLAGTPNSAIFFDPARRQDHRRAFTVEDYSPPLSILQSWLPHIPALGVKISPGVNLNELSGYDCEVEFISLNGELKEAMLWFGRFKTAGMRATLLPGPITLTADRQPVLPLAEPGAYIYEPDPAVIRAGLVSALGAQLNGAQLDPEIAYLTAGSYTPTPFARAWQVEDWLPFQLKNLRAYLRQRDVGPLTVKKRGSPIIPEQLIQDLRLDGNVEKTLFLTQMEGKPIVVVAKPDILKS
jgi:SAM-dependent methyltransferase